MVVMPDRPTTASWDASGSQSWANVLSPGIVGLFIQGIETGMVFSQLATWLSLPRRTEHCFVTTVTVFVTTVGLIQTAVYFFSTWRIYVEHYGEPVIPTWTERIHIFLTVLISTPVQSLLLWRCYCILKRSMYFIIPLVSLLLGTVALGIFDTIWLLTRTYGWGRSSHLHPFWSLLMYSASSSVLDIILSSICEPYTFGSWECDSSSLISGEHPVFFYLTQSRKRVYADQAVQWISRLIIIVWQSAIPPTVCAIGFFLTYILSHHLHPGQKQMWYPTLHAVIGKLYVLSHFYNMYVVLALRFQLCLPPRCRFHSNSLTFFVGEQEQPSTHLSALTVPALHGTNTAHNTPEEHRIELYSNSIEGTDEWAERYCSSELNTAPVPHGSV
ncbi:hypothetical protein EDB84DRAFT_1514964 [Lactarius hengduanensis]|nr:hypothetical protein EDB84DRAFT_1514964 [Lactarius hengduanensis]